MDRNVIRKNSGFTLVEVIVTVVIVGIMSGIVTISSAYVMQEMNEKSILVTLSSALEKARYQCMEGYGENTSVILTMKNNGYYLIVSQKDVAKEERICSDSHILSININGIPEEIDQDVQFFYSKVNGSLKKITFGEE